MSNIIEIKSLSELHKILGTPPPKHPNISLLKYSEMKIPENIDFERANLNFYTISFKTFSGRMRYGRTYYDFEEGTMTFTAPNQVLYTADSEYNNKDIDGWSLFIQPNLLYGTDLGKKIDDYSFFSYDSNEALHLSDDEKKKILDLIQNIEDECTNNINQDSGDLIVSNLELLLNYCRRFYNRQFYTRSFQNKDVVIKLEKYLKDYFNSDKPIESGIPKVKDCAEVVNLSPNYLSDLLKKETGKNTKEYIDFYLLEKGKTLLLNTEMYINEIAYGLGFEYAKSFSKLFKKKTGITPKEFRQIH